jgi:hypothetical protein
MSNLIQIIGFSIIIAIGIVMNLINIVIFRQRTMIVLSTFHLLFYLSIIDLFVLLICATDALLTYGFFYELRNVSVISCKFHTFLTYFLTHMSSILLMIVSIERTFVIYNKSFFSFLRLPAKTNIGCLNRRKRILNVFGCIIFNRIRFLFFLIFFIIFMINSHFLSFLTLISLKTVSKNVTNNFTNEFYDYNFDNNRLLNDSLLITTTMCFPHHQTFYNYFVLKIFVWIDISLYSVIPFVAMLITSALILIKIRNKNSNRFLMQNRTNRRLSKRRNRKNNQMLVMLLATNALFIICSLPYSILINQDLIHPDYRQFLNQQYLIIHMLAYSNKSVNFVFYLTFSLKYRQAFFSLFQNANISSNQQRKSIISENHVRISRKRVS